MIEIKGNNAAFFDVDDTLILYTYPDHRLDEEIEIGIEGSLLQAKVVPHTRHVEMVKLHKTWGNTVVVWSRSGHEWARAVVEKLGLIDYVDVCMAKPFYYYDDKKCCQILGEHRYQQDSN
jgi:phosphoserine phosphatase